MIVTHATRADTEPGSFRCGPGPPFGGGGGANP